MRAPVNFLLWIMKPKTKITEHIVRMLWSLFAYGLSPDSDIEPLRKIFLLNSIIILGCFFLGVLGTLSLFQGYMVLVFVDFSFSFFLVLLFLYLRKTKNHMIVSCVGCIITGCFYFFLVVSSSGQGSTFMWSFSYPLITIFLLGIKIGTIYAIVLLGLNMFVFILGPQIDFLPYYPLDITIRFPLAYITIYFFSFAMEKVREVFQGRLQESRQQLAATVTELDRANSKKEQMISDLHQAMKEVQVLRGILPICSECKQIRNDKGYWQRIEQYIQEHSEAQFSHGLCPKCAKKLYPDIF